MKLAPKLTILFLLLAIVPTAIVGYLAYENGRQTTMQETIHHLVSINIFKSNELKRWVEDIESSIEELAQRPLVKQYAEVLAKHDTPDHAYHMAKGSIVEDHLRPRLKYGGFFELFLMCPRHGLISASTNKKQEGKHRDTYPYFIEGKSRTYIQGIYYSPVMEQPAMTISTSIKDKQGNLMGVLGGRLDLRELSKIIALQSGESQTEDTYLVNTFNFFVTEPRFGQDYALKKAVRTEGVEAGLSGKDGVGFYKDYRGVYVIGAYKWLPEFNMCIITEKGQAEAFAPIVHLAWVITGIASAISIAAGLLGLFFTRTITRPVQKLATGAEEIGGGNLEHRVGTASKDEIGGLSRAFDRMTENLKATMVSRDELALSEERFRIGAASASDLIWDWNISSGRLDWFGNIDGILGYHPGEFPRTIDAWGEAIHNDDVARVNATLERHLKEGEAYYEEYRIKCKDGTYRYWTDRGTAMRDEKGEPYRMIGACSDITERQQAEEALKSSERQFRAVMDQAADALFIHNTQGQLVDVNRRACQSLGYTREELLSKTITDIDPEAIEAGKEALWNKVIAGEVAIFESHHKRKDGDIFPVEIVLGSICLDPETLILAIVRDITDRKLVEEALRESEDRYRDLVEHSHDLFCTHDLEGKLLSVNPAALKIGGYSKDELLSMNFRDFLAPEVRGQFGNYLTEIQAKGTASGVMLVQTKGGEKRLWEYHNTLRTEGVAAPIVRGMARDITERKQAEEEVRRKAALLEAISSIFKGVMVCETSEEVGRLCLTLAQELTGSKFGFIGEVNKEGRFDTIALSDPVWEKCKMPKTDALVMINNVEIRGIWGRVIKSGESLIVNQPSSHPDRVGVPEGHPLITAFLGVPLKQSGRTIGMISLANKESGYSSVDQEMVENLSIAFVEALMRKRAEEALQKSEERYRNILSSIEEGYFEVDIAGNFTFFNDSLCKILGYSRTEMMGMNNRQYMDKENAQKVFQAFNQVYTTGEPHLSYDWGIIRKDGAKRFNESSVSLIRDSKGEKVGFRGIVHDITERKQAEEAFRESEKKYRQVIENATEIIYSIDTKGNFTYANPAGLKVVGYSLEELLRFNYLDLVIPEHRERITRVYIKQFREKQKTTYVEFPFFNKSGEVAWFGQNASLVIEDGKVVGFHIIARDITERKRAEEALKKSEERFRELYDDAPVGYFEYDTQGCITNINRTELEMLGYTREEMIGQPVWKFIVRGEEAHNQILAKLADTMPPARGLERNYKKKDGTVLPVSIEDRILRDPQGKIIGIRCTIQDITGRKRAEEVLRETEEMVRVLLNATTDSVFLIDTAGIFLALNEMTAKRLGKSADELLGAPVYDFIPLHLGKARRAHFDEVARSGLPAHFEDERQGICFDNSVYPIFDPHGEVAKLAIYARDITDRKCAEENLKQSEENARQLAQENAIMAEVGRIISSTLDIDEVYEGFSAEVKKIIPFDRIVIDIIDTEKNTVRNVYMAGKGLQDRNVKDIYPLEGSGNAEMVRTKSTLLIQTEDFNEYKDRFPMLLSTFQAGFRSIMNVPLFSKGKIIGGLLLRSHKPYTYTDKDVRLAERIASQIAGAVANAQLYAERIHSEEERTILQEQLRQSQKMEAIGQLAGGVAHDFNNILTVIKGYSQLSLAEMKEEDPFRENIEEIKKSADRAADLTRQLLAFSRRQMMEMKVLDLNDSLRNLDKMLRRLIGEDIELVTLLTEDLGRVNADPGQIEQVIMNLAVNARDAMPNGGKLTIETADVELDEEYARAHIAVKPGAYVMLSVSDSGMGMTQGVRDRVFEPFFTTKETGKGTGLGLSTVYGIVKQSGGNIWVYSEPGKGTTFKIYLPRVDEPLEELKEKMVKEEIPRGNETILIVEDEEDVLTLAGRILSRQGYKVLEVTNGGEALEVCREEKQPIHLILTDVVMPQMSGRELIERCREIRQDFKAIYMSGYTDNTITHHGILEKGLDYIQKPFTIEGLTRKVREVLDK